MTREEIIKQFQGKSETTTTVYIFRGSLTDLQKIAATSIRTLQVAGVLYFMSIDENYIPTDPRMEIL